jgi:trehalose 6-phosphate phosphatase
VRENRTHGSEGGEGRWSFSTPISRQAILLFEGAATHEFASRLHRFCGVPVSLSRLMSLLALQRLVLPPLSTTHVALFLDFDGTLVDLAPQPDAVRVPPELVHVLQRLAERLDGALAVVSGRRLADLDHFLAPLKLPLAAEHGALRRLASGQLTEPRPPELGEATAVADGLVIQYPGLLMERKTSSVALHYRQRPELAQLCLAAMAEVCERTPGTELMRGKCVVELKPLGVDKGLAMASFMKEPPFASRLPWFAGDDLTDEAGFVWAQQAGGAAIKVGEGATAAQHHCPSPAALRLWLVQTLADWPAHESSSLATAPHETPPHAAPPPASSQAFLLQAPTSARHRTP